MNNKKQTIERENLTKPELYYITYTRLLLQEAVKLLSGLYDKNSANNIVCDIAIFVLKRDVKLKLLQIIFNQEVLSS